MKPFVLAAAIALATTPVLAQSVTEKTGVNTLLGVAPSTADFVTKTAASGLLEIAASRLAVERADPATKAFAEEMVRDHERLSGELKQLLESQAITVAIPTEMTGDQKATLAKLQELQGPEFSGRYHSDQVKAHADAVDLFQRYGEKGEQTAIRTWAVSTLPTLRRHLDMAKELNR
jgi:putative membrane protein